MSSLNEQELSAQVNKIANVIIPEFYDVINKNFSNVMIYVHSYLYVHIFTISLLFCNLIISVIILQKFNKLTQQVRNVPNNA